MVKLISIISNGAFAGTARNDFPPVDHNTTNREFSPCQRLFGQLESLLHEIVVIHIIPDFISSLNVEYFLQL
jgi:hypothetical protein